MVHSLPAITLALAPQQLVATRTAASALIITPGTDLNIAGSGNIYLFDSASGSITTLANCVCVSFKSTAHGAVPRLPAIEIYYYDGTEIDLSRLWVAGDSPGDIVTIAYLSK